MMPLRPGLLFLSLGILFALAAASPIVAAVPEILIAEGESLPTWVSAAAATTDGEPDWSVFSPGAEQGIRNLLQVREEAALAENEERGHRSLEELREDCIWSGVAGGRGIAAPGAFRPDGTLEELQTHAVAVYHGLIVDEAQGFLYDLPGLLLEVEVQSTLKPTTKSDPAHSPSYPEHSLLVFYPEAMIPLGGQLLCATAHRGFERPGIGRQILVFEFPGERLTANLLAPFAGHLIFETPEGHLSLPRQLRPAPGNGERFDSAPKASFQSLSEVIETVTEGLGKLEKEN